MRIAGIQHDIVWEDADANRRRVAPLVARAVAAGAELVVLPELFATGFSMAVERIAEPEDGPSVTFLHEQARRHGVWVGGSVAVRLPGDARPANLFVLAGPDGTAARYAKIHPFTFANEHEHYRAGDTAVTVTVGGMRTSLFVCYDLRFADEQWAVAPDTDLYLFVASWPSARREHWLTLLRARAVENQAFVVGVNRVGSGGGLDYAGDSCVIDPLGEVLASAAHVETIVLADVDPAVVVATRQRFPFMADRRGRLGG